MVIFFDVTETLKKAAGNKQDLAISIFRQVATPQLRG